VSGNNSAEAGGTNYVIMLDSERGGEQKGVFPHDEGSAVSSLSDNPTQHKIS